MDSDPIFVTSAPPSVESARPSESVPSVVNLAGCSSVGSARDIVNSDRQPSASDIVFDEDRGRGDAGAPELQPIAGLEQPAGGDLGEADGDAPVPAAVVSHAVRGDRKYGQGRPGPKHGRGGRKLGSGRHTKENFATAVRRVVGAYLCKVSAATLSSDCGISAEAGVNTIELLSAWAKAPGNEEVWLLPGMLGVVARWGEWNRDGTGDHASVCVWLAANGRCRCTFVGSNIHRDSNVYDRATTLLPSVPPFTSSRRPLAGNLSVFDTTSTRGSIQGQDQKVNMRPRTIPSSTSKELCTLLFARRLLLPFQFHST